jgi:hypothetical protein
MFFLRLPKLTQRFRFEGVSKTSSHMDLFFIFIFLLFPRLLNILRETLWQKDITWVLGMSDARKLVFDTKVSSFTIYKISRLKAWAVFLIQFINFINLKIVKSKGIFLVDLILFINPKIFYNIFDYYYQIVFKNLNISE